VHAQARRGERRRGPDLLEELADQPVLAGARLALDEDEVPPSLEDVLEVVRKEPRLGCPGKEGRLLEHLARGLAHPAATSLQHAHSVLCVSLSLRRLSSPWAASDFASFFPTPRRSSENSRIPPGSSSDFPADSAPCEP